jgi:hypothetical protein
MKSGEGHFQGMGLIDLPLRVSRGPRREMCQTGGTSETRGWSIWLVWFFPKGTS